MSQPIESQINKSPNNKQAPIQPPQANINYPYSYLNSNGSHNFSNNYSDFGYPNQQHYWNGYQQQQQIYYQQQHYNHHYHQQQAQFNPNYFNSFKNNNRFHASEQANPNRAENANYQQNNNQFQRYQNNNHNNQNRNNKNFNRNNRSNQINFQNNQNNNKGKTRIDKRDLPENNLFNCEVCDRGFNTEMKYKEHCDTHTTCSVSGCKFTAAEKLVKIHYMNFHASGIDKKVPKLETPEEIQEYINQRKKNFPSNLNLEKKQKLDEEKTERGVVLDTRQFGRLKKLNKNNKFDKQSNPTAKKDHENPPGEGANKDESNLSKTLNNKINKNRKKNKKKFKHNFFQTPRKPTLLQKLLADEIRHERNIILQCVRYCVEKNFFENQQRDIKEKEIEDIADTSPIVVSSDNLNHTFSPISLETN